MRDAIIGFNDIDESGIRSLTIFFQVYIYIYAGLVYIISIFMATSCLVVDLQALYKTATPSLCDVMYRGTFSASR